VLKIKFCGQKMKLCNKKVFFIKKFYYIYPREQIRGGAMISLFFILTKIDINRNNK